MQPFEKYKPAYQAEKGEGAAKSIPEELAPVRNFIEHEIVEAEDTLSISAEPVRPEDQARHEAALEAAGLEYDADSDRDFTVEYSSIHGQKIKNLRRIQKAFGAGDFGSVVPYLKSYLEESDSIAKLVPRSKRGQLDYDRHKRMLDIVERYLSRE